MASTQSDATAFGRMPWRASIRVWAAWISRSASRQYFFPSSKFAARTVSAYTGAGNGTKDGEDGSEGWLASFNVPALPPYRTQGYCSPQAGRKPSRAPPLVIGLHIAATDSQRPAATTERPARN